jgi:hypothetical protein
MKLVISYQNCLALLISMLAATLIMALVSVGLFFRFNNLAQKKQATYQADIIQAKDAKIKADLKAIQLALGRYKAKNNIYPADLQELKVQDFMFEIPKNPYSNQEYYYLGSTGDYYLSTILGNGDEYRVEKH